MSSWIRRLQHYFPAGFLLALSLAAYGRLVIQPGFFGDDPQMLFAFHRFGAAGYRHALGWSRPFGLWVYAPLYTLFGDHPALWQLGAILLRTLSAWLLFHLLERVNESWRAPALWAAAACLVYPGFGQQAHALQFSLHWAALSASLASQVLMLCTLEEENQKHRLAFLVFSLLLAALGILTTEYFIGLELLRFLILWIYLTEKSKRAFPAALYRWLPYLGILLAFSIWRLFAAEIRYPSPLLLDDLEADTGEALTGVLARIPRDAWQSGIIAWGNTFVQQASHMDSCLYIGLGSLAAVIICFILHRLSQKDIKGSVRDALMLTAIGCVLTLAGGLPLWISKTTLALSFPENRTTLCLMVGVCLTLAGLAAMLRQAGRLLSSILLGFSLVFQFTTCSNYIQAWGQLRNFFQQLTTCAPGLEPGTALLYEEPFIFSYPANSLSALLNWSYDPENHGEGMAYDMLRVSERLGKGIPALAPDLPIQHGTFQGSTSQVLVVTLDEKKCLQFLYKNNEVNTAIPPLLDQARRLSNPQAIISNPDQPAQPPEFLKEADLQTDCSSDCF